MDKVELIHRRIEEIKANTKDKQFASPYNTGRVDLCNELLSLIDSVKEEPKDPCKDPQYIQELKYKLDSMSKEEFDKEWDKCKPDGEEPSIPEICNEHWYEMLKKEPVSEDLEEFALQYAGHHAPYDSCMQEVEDAVKAGANWQKQKDLKWLADNHKQIFNNGWADGYEDGRDSMEEDMTKDAVDARCFGFQSGEALFSIKLPADKYLVGSKIKVVIIKEDSV